MVNLRMYQRIRKLKALGWSKSKIARELKLDRGTVARYSSMSETGFRACLQDMRNRPKILDTFRADILDVYEANGNRKLNMASVYDFLEEKHGSLPCSEKTLRNYVRRLIENGQLVLSNRGRAFSKVPELPFGKQVQIDFGQYKTESGCKIYIFAAVLSASRYKYAAFQDRPFRTLDVIHHLLDTFDYFGGRPEELVIDQDAVLVASENRGDIVYTESFSAFVEEMDLQMYVCRKADPQSKGKIENCIKFIKENFFGSRDFANIEDANQSLADWLFRRANGKISQATRRIPEDLIELEKSHLRGLRNSIFRKDSAENREIRRVNDKSFISFQGSQYSVPERYRGRSVEVYCTGSALSIYEPSNGSMIAEHEISLLQGQKIQQKGHFRSTERKSRELQEHVQQMYDLPEWREFAERNQKLFQRYVRDQCTDARNYFGHGVHIEPLKKALQFCLENQTLAFADLRDAYLHFLKTEETVNSTQDPHPVTEDIERPEERYGKHEKLTVATRSLDEYTDRTANRRAS